MFISRRICDCELRQRVPQSSSRCGKAATPDGLTRQVSDSLATELINTQGPRSPIESPVPIVT